MKEILQAELGALGKLIGLLEEEKTLLVKLKDHLLFKVVDAKRIIVEEIESLEKQRKERYSDEELQAYLRQGQEGRGLLKEIEAAMARVRELQETNLMLTTQSIIYNNQLIETIQDAIVKAPAVYSGKGYMKPGRQGVRAAFDQTV